MTVVRGAVELLAGFVPPLLVLGATSYVLGRTLIRGLGPRLELELTGRLERAAVATALGLALTAHGLVLLGFAGLLRPLPLLLLAAAVLAAGAPVGRELLGDLRGLSARSAAGRTGAALLALAPLAVLPLYPATAFDATLYHLPFARAFIESGGVPFLPDRRVPVFPQANELLFAAVLPFGGDVAAHGVQLLATLLTALLLVAWARTAWPSWGSSGWLAAALFLGNPIVVHLAGTGYVEPGLTLFVTASLFSLDRWRQAGGWAWLALAALFGAMAADVKYLGLYFLGMAGLIVALTGWRSRPLRTRLRDTLLFLAVAAAFLAPWYLRIYLHTGNPLFPFLPGVFGHGPWDAVHGSGEPLLSRLARWLRMPWDLVFERARYNQQPPFSPLYLAAVPAVALVGLRLARVWGLLVIAGLYSLLFLWLPPDGRYLVPILPLASLAVAGSVSAAIERWQGFAPRRLFAALALLCFLPGWLYAGYRVARQGPPPLTAIEREDYLTRRLPVYPAIAALNRELGRGYVLWAWRAENMAYFADGRFLGDWFGPASFAHVQAAAPDAESLHRELRRLGATHLLLPARGLDGREIAPPVPEDEAFRRWFALVYQDRHARVYALRAVGDPPHS